MGQGASDCRPSEEALTLDMFIRARARREVLEEGIVAIRADQEGETRAGHQIVVFCEKGRGGEGKAKGRRREGEKVKKENKEREPKEKKRRM